MRLTPLLLAAALLACATARRAPPGPAAPAKAELAFPPEEVKVTPLDLELATKNDEELFAIGVAAAGAGDHARAAAAFSRLADLFPASPHEAAALYDAGLAYEALERWDAALDRFRTLARKYEGRDALEATFKVAECLYHLGELDEAWRVLDGVAGREGLAPGDRVRAVAQRGVLELERGDGETAERSFRVALSLFEAERERGGVDPYWAALAQYHLGETYRTWFRALPLDPSSGDDRKLADELEHKAEMLLSAQGHYLRTIRLGDDRWAVAAGFRIGELYDELRRQLLEAPLPPGLDAEAAAAYRAGLRGRVKVLAAKAITAYQETLGRAARSGVDDLRFLSEAQASLARLEAALAEDAATAPGTTPAATSP